MTPWGPAVNLDQPGSEHVRRHILDNVQMWLRDYHVDGLRLDAVHAFVDERATHLLEEMSVEVEALGAQLRKPLFLVAESDLNDARTVTAREAGGKGLQGQWADDVHHALHANLTGETSGYYGDFLGLPVLAKVLTKVFLHDGTFSTFRGRVHGRPVPPSTTGHPFVVYLQDHDQVGNRATGDRISATLPDGLLKVGAALVLTSPYTPMLWMGEEWGARTPWQFFSDHEGELGEAVRKGRRAEFGAHGWNTEDVPDPQSEQTFRDSTLDWSEPEQAAARRPAGLDAVAHRPAPLAARPVRRAARPDAGDLRRGRPLARRAARAAARRLQPRQRARAGAGARGRAGARAGERAGIGLRARPGRAAPAVGGRGGPRTLTPGCCEVAPGRPPACASSSPGPPGTWARSSCPSCSRRRR